MRLGSYLPYATLTTTCGAAVAQSTGTPTTSPAFHTVTAGYQNGFQFIPSNITANPGDTIVFLFETDGHSVVKADHGNPCIPFDTIHPGEPSFFSGFFNDTTPPKTWNLTVNDTLPVYFYCSAQNSCLKEHMIGVINPNATYTLAEQQSFITSNSIMLQPGQELLSEASSTTSATSSPSHKGVSLSTGAIVGIAIAGVAILGLACALFWFIGRHRTMKQENSAVGRWVDSYGGPPSSFGPTSMQGDASTTDTPKAWEVQPLYGYPSPQASPQPQVQEMGVAEVSELEDHVQDRGRSRTIAYRHSAPVKTAATMTTQDNVIDVYEKE